MKDSCIRVRCFFSKVYIPYFFTPFRTWKAQRAAPLFSAPVTLSFCWVYISVRVACITQFSCYFFSLYDLMKDLRSCSRFASSNLRCKKGKCSKPIGYSWEAPFQFFARNMEGKNKQILSPVKDKVNPF